MKKIKTKTFKSEYILGAKVTVSQTTLGFILNYGSGAIYRFNPIPRNEFLNELENNMSYFYAEKITDYFYSEETLGVKL